MERCKTCGHEVDIHDRGVCHRFQKGALLGCHCPRFVSPSIEALSGLSAEDKVKVACLYSFGIDPEIVSDVKFKHNLDGHPVGISVELFFKTDKPEEWINDHIPKYVFPKIKFLSQKVVDLILGLATKAIERIGE